MAKTLHLLKSQPDETVSQFISDMNCDGATTVVCLYPDEITGAPVDWDRVIEDIMSHDKVITWW